MTLTKKGLSIAAAFVVVLALAIVVIVRLESDLDGKKSALKSTKATLAATQAQHAKDVTAQKSAQATIDALKAQIMKLDPPAWTKAVAARKYLAMAKPGNDQIDGFNKLAYPDFREVRRYCAAMTRLDNKFAQALHAGHWPKFALSAVNQLIDSVARQTGSYASRADAKTVAAQDAVVFDQNNKAAQKVRILLGLPAAT